MQSAERHLALFLFVDALGWEVLRANPWFLEEELPYRTPLETILGYSSACDPSIISGKRPGEHGYWSSFYYAPDQSPFQPLRYLKALPEPIGNHHRIRHKVSQLFGWWRGFDGYFQLYNVPYSRLPQFDYAEKYSIWNPGGMGATSTIFDLASAKGVPYFVDDSGCGDEQQFQRVEQAIQGEGIRFAYLLLGRLDALMHAEGTKSPKVQELLNWYEQRIQELLRRANEQYDEVTLYLFSDHGMHNVLADVDLAAEVNCLSLREGHDYVAFYDSTMARFWFKHESARHQILKLLQGLKIGKVLTDHELKEFGVFFPDGKYGELIFLVDPGVLIVPSYMGRKRIAGMHGYHPSDPDSLASICGSVPLPPNLRSIEQIYSLMKEEAGLMTKVVL